jgi:uncharacterized lipoprotein YddW (UPF0748 family)
MTTTHRRTLQATLAPARAIALAIVLVLAAAPAARSVPTDEAGTTLADSAFASVRADSMRPDSAALARVRVAVGAAADSSTREGVEYLWVLRNSLIDPDAIPRLVERARGMQVRGLIVQVVGRGDGWYRSDLLPYPEPLRTPGRDPLGELLPLAHAAGLEVHAWINCCLVWSGPRPPRDPRHVLHAHPEWVACTSDGRPMTRLSEYARRRLSVEGVFLSPAHPGVRCWIARVAKEIVSRYAVDGIHLDYIRQPGVAVGFDPTSRARFALGHGADPLRFERLSAPERAAMDSAWSAFQTDQVTAIVREVRDSVEATRPGVSLSAAVLADTLTALQRNHQAWGGWLRSGLLDRAFPMCYAPPVQTVMNQLATLSGEVGTARLVPGIAIYNTTPSAAAAKIKGARALGFPAIALYSYDSLWERADLWTRLRGFLNGPSVWEEQP